MKGGERENEGMDEGSKAEPRRMLPGGEREEKGGERNEKSRVKGTVFLLKKF